MNRDTQISHPVNLGRPTSPDFDHERELAQQCLQARQEEKVDAAVEDVIFPLRMKYDVEVEE